MRLALTFDDGPSEWTPALLDVLREHGARATFFVLGANVAGREAILRRAAAEGHELGNHTWSHRELRDCGPDEIVREIERTTDAIESATGKRPRLFRAPHDRPGARAETIAAARGLGYATFDVDPEDWQPGVGAAEIARRVLDAVQDGSIVDLHDGHPPYESSARTDCAPTVAAVRLLLPELGRRGYELVTVSEL